MSLGWRAYGLLTLVAILAAVSVWLYFSALTDRRPGLGSSSFEEYTRAFQVGLAALDSDLLPQAEESLLRCTQLIPQEPAAWANLGLLYLRSQRLEESDKYLQHARELAPNSTEIAKLIAHLHSHQGQFDEAAAILEEVVKQEPDDIRSLYQLIQVTEQRGVEQAEQKQWELLERLVKLEPQNTRLLIDRLRLAIKLNDQSKLAAAQTELEKHASSWLPRTVTAWEELKKSLQQASAGANRPPLLRFSNSLLAEPAFARDSAKLEAPEEFVGQPLINYVWVEALQRKPAPADTLLTFSPTNFGTQAKEACRFALPFWPTTRSTAKVLAARDHSLQLENLRIDIDPKKVPTSTAELICFDADNDLHTDILIASRGGLQLFFNRGGLTFEDATATLKLEGDVVEGSYAGGCSMDYDLDGDLDVMLYVQDAAPVFLRNNFDLTFTAVRPLPGAGSVRLATWGDFDNDGAIDVATMDSGKKVRVWANQRSGQFVPWPAAIEGQVWLAVTSFDATGDGQTDIVAVLADGQLLAISDLDKRVQWTTTTLCSADPELSRLKDTPGISLFEADLDNNGSMDLMLTSDKLNHLWLSENPHRFQTCRTKLAGRLLGVADWSNDGRLDLLTLDGSGMPIYLRNSGEKSYGWLEVWPQASRGKVDGDNRINSFGVGGIAELRAGSLISTQIIRGPLVHFGLGNNLQADVVRLLWPNGSFQYEFTPAANQSIVAQQRLKGSCPFLFAWNGEQFEFVTDFMWSTPLGMFINAADKGGFLQTTDWVKVSAQQLQAREGIYEIRVNANLWETHYFDHLALRAIDHPANVQLVVDEKFFMEPVAPKLHWIGPPGKLERVVDHQGHDVSQVLAAVDGQHLDLGQRGRYQGLTSEHWIEFDVPADDPGKERWLLARGWIHPTDSSVNYAIAQGEHSVPHGLVLERQAANGNWLVVHDRLGFPAGKNKTVIIPLDPRAKSSGPANSGSVRYRLRTNLEIYWDWAGLVSPLDSVEFKDETLMMASAELRVRGIVDMQQASPSSPELPVYQRLVSRGQYWRDLIGYHTRPGDIRELLTSVDDRYAILTAGDEVVLRFHAPLAPPTGWVRDFVWVSDGWVKDGDFNTRFGKTVLPLPTHDMTAYQGDADILENDPVYQRFSKDWDDYHTRHINTFEFDRGLRRFLKYRNQEPTP